uniref:Heme-binding protein soul2 n=1 Tax=Amphiprion ocellaris TaxID=80972 RepID=A0A3Q1AW12_AMPOC
QTFLINIKTSGFPTRFFSNASENKNCTCVKHVLPPQKAAFGPHACCCFVSPLSAPGFQFHSAAWPALITHTEAEDGPQWFLSWFVPPDTTKPESSDPSVTLQNKPAATVYVKVFDGTPSRERGLEKAKLLQNALEKAGKSFDSSTYVGAGYESYFSLFHHNEIWIYAE